MCQVSVQRRTEPLRQAAAQSPPATRQATSYLEQQPSIPNIHYQRHTIFTTRIRSKPSKPRSQIARSKPLRVSLAPSNRWQQLNQTGWVSEWRRQQDQRAGRLKDRARVIIRRAQSFFTIISHSQSSKTRAKSRVTWAEPLRWTIGQNFTTRLIP